MQMIIKLDNATVNIPYGRISNIFKSLGFKDLKFEENAFTTLCTKKNLQTYFNEDMIYKIALKRTEDFMKTNKEQFHYNYNQLCIKNLLLKNHVKPEQFINEMDKAKEQVLENKSVLEKINKLKKLKAVNL